MPLTQFLTAFSVSMMQQATPNVLSTSSNHLYTAYSNLLGRYAVLTGKQQRIVSAFTFSDKQSKEMMALDSHETSASVLWSKRCSVSESRNFQQYSCENSKTLTLISSTVWQRHQNPLKYSHLQNIRVLFTASNKPEKRNIMIEMFHATEELWRLTLLL
jgi:hypothetical protein